jgi:phenylacetic acid degradation operon negative regulatory protein
MTPPARDRQTAGTQSLLATLLGDYSWGDIGAPVPASVFTRVLAEFGISEMAARLALERVAARGLLVRIKDGRSVLYALSDWAITRHRERFAHILGVEGQQAGWDGTWTLVLASVPEAQREQRAQLRARLLAAGFARLYDAAWLRPGSAAVATARALLESLDTAEPLQVTVLSARHEAGFGGRDPLEAYDLKATAAAYATFLARHTPLVRSAREGRTRDADAFVRRTRLMDAWRSAIRSDPELPAELLPAGFPRAAARALFVEAYDRLGPPAAERLRRIVAEVSPEIAPHLRHRASSLAGPDVLAPIAEPSPRAPDHHPARRRRQP